MDIKIFPIDLVQASGHALKNKIVNSGLASASRSFSWGSLEGFIEEKRNKFIFIFENGFVVSLYNDRYKHLKQRKEEKKKLPEFSRFRNKSC